MEMVLATSAQAFSYAALVAAPGAVKVISMAESGLRTSLDPMDAAGLSSEVDMKSCMLLLDVERKVACATMLLFWATRDTPKADVDGANALVLAVMPMRARAKAIFDIRNMICFWFVN